MQLDAVGAVQVTLNDIYRCTYRVDYHLWEVTVLMIDAYRIRQCTNQN